VVFSVGEGFEEATSMGLLAAKSDGPATAPISPLRELGAYEALWLEPKASFKSIAEKFAKDPMALPSDFVSAAAAEAAYRETVATLTRLGVSRFGVRIHGAGDYPDGLRDAVSPVELLYFRGSWELAYSPCVSIVGTRAPTPQGIARAERVAKLLVSHKFTVVSGLASGIDTVAHRTAIALGGQTIAVIGTHIGRVYPKENAELQADIAAKHLVISQVPILRYERSGAGNPTTNRWFFPERNKTMSALTRATVIIEAGETSGTLVQARAALQQGRKLLLLDSLFDRPGLTWPARMLEQGAIRVRDPEDILDHIGAAT
jgi:DNA processing protein